MVQKTANVKKKDFSFYAKLSIGLGVLYFLLIGAWYALQLTEILGIFKITDPQNQWIQILYYVLFTLTSLATPSWIAVLALMYVKGIDEKLINSKQYKTHVIIISTLIIVLLLSSAIFSLVWDSSHNLWDWSGYLSSSLLILDLHAVLYGIIISGVGLANIKK